MKPQKNDFKFYLVFGGIVYLVCLFLITHFTYIATEYPALQLGNIIKNGLEHASNMPLSIEFSGLTIKWILYLTGAFAFVVFWLRIEGQRNSQTMPGKENGTAKWNTDLKKYNKQYSDPVNKPENNGPNNMLLTQNISLSMKSFITKRNNNILAVGGSGAGKSRFLVKPNILQANCNYIITDPAGELLASTGKFLEDKGYEIKVFNLVEMAKSDCYNPFNYIRDELGVLMMINCLITNTNGGKTGGDPFWEKSETALLQALCFYLIKYCPKEQQNFTSVMKLLRAAEVDENNLAKKSKLDMIFDEVAAKDPTSIALKQYLTFKMGAGKTLKSILISCSVRLTVFNMQQIENLTKIDTLDLGLMGEGKKALFVIIPAADSTYNFLVSMMYSQLFETLYFTAETKYENKRLERPVRFLMDEFANIGQVPEFTKKLATMRKYEISCTIILQNLAQIKTMYKDDWESIVGNCDSFLYLGGQEYSTLEYLSKELGTATIVVRNNSRSIGKSNSHSLSYNRASRSLMNPDEIMKMDENDCILLIRGLDPFYGPKYDYLKHPNYKFTGDADQNNSYNNKKNNANTFAFEEIQEGIQKDRANEYKQKTKDMKEGRLDVGPIPAKTATKSLNINTIADIPKKITISNPDAIKTVKKNDKKKNQKQPTNKTFDITPDGETEIIDYTSYTGDV